jgi:hypothetical protein
MPQQLVLSRRKLIRLAAPVIIKTPRLLMSINAKNLMLDFTTVRPVGNRINNPLSAARAEELIEAFLEELARQEKLLFYRGVNRFS